MPRTRSIFFRAHSAHGFAFKLHTEQFTRVGGLELGVELGALSVDHLEACSPAQLSQLSPPPQRSPPFFPA